MRKGDLPYVRADKRGSAALNKHIDAYIVTTAILSSEIIRICH